MKIFLIGMMGSGKTYWANRLAKKLDLQGYDLDRLVERVEDRTIEKIFAESGEDHFRKMESIVLKWFADKDDFILATGGGTPCYFDNMEWMNREGITIWLDESIDTLLKRLVPGKAHRPLIAALNDDEIGIYLEKKREERMSFYSQARFTLHEKEVTEKNMLSLINNKKDA